MSKESMLERVTIRISPEQRKLIEQKASETGISVSDYIKTAVFAHLDQRETIRNLLEGQQARQTRVILDAMSTQNLKLAENIVSPLLNFTEKRHKVFLAFGRIMFALISAMRVGTLFKLSEEEKGKLNGEAKKDFSSIMETLRNAATQWNEEELEAFFMRPVK